MGPRAGAPPGTQWGLTEVPPMEETWLSLVPLSSATPPTPPLEDLMSQKAQGEHSGGPCPYRPALLCRPELGKGFWKGISQSAVFQSCVL